MTVRMYEGETSPNVRTFIILTYFWRFISFFIISGVFLFATEVLIIVISCIGSILVNSPAALPLPYFGDYSSALLFPDIWLYSAFMLIRIWALSPLLKVVQRISKGNKMHLLIFGLLLLAINIMGAICIVGVFFTLPVTALAFVAVYKKLNGEAEELEVVPEPPVKIYYPRIVEQLTFGLVKVGFSLKTNISTMIIQLVGGIFPRTFVSEPLRLRQKLRFFYS